MLGQHEPLDTRCCASGNVKQSVLTLTRYGANKLHQPVANSSMRHTMAATVAALPSDESSGMFPGCPKVQDTLHVNCMGTQ